MHRRAVVLGWSVVFALAMTLWMPFQHGYANGEVSAGEPACCSESMIEGALDADDFPPFESVAASAYAGPCLVCACILTLTEDAQTLLYESFPILPTTIHAGWSDKPEPFPPRTSLPS